MDPNFEAGSKRIYTFYSFKGGVGRSMALANVAALLARWDQRVLIVDWDLEAPGIERYFESVEEHILDDVRRLPGVVNLAEAVAAGSPIDWRQCLLEISIFPSKSPISLLTAGRRDDQFVRRLQGLDWEQLFLEFDFGMYLENLRKEWVEEFDYILVDSRTGVTDIGGICTIYLPDIIVALFTANKQSLNGVIDVVRRAREARDHLPFDRGYLLAVPVPGRDESRTEYRQALEWRRTFAVELYDLYKDFLPKEIDATDALELLRIPYVPYWSFGERLPVIYEGTRDPNSISFYYAVLTRLLGSGLQWSQISDFEGVPALPGSLRDMYVEREADVTAPAPPQRPARQWAGSPQDERVRDRIGMLKRVRQAWIQDVLENSLDKRTRIVLGRVPWSEAVQERRMELWRKDRNPEHLPVGTTVREVFNQAGGRLLILGAPGSGKTTALLELTRHLLSQADYDAAQPMPVVFNLSSWAEHQQPLTDWLVEELHHSYDVPWQIAKYWVDNDSILPLLDGLDELAKGSLEACISAISEFQRTKHFGELVVCSRTEEYQILATRLQLEDAIVLQPLTPQQIYRYLDTVGPPLADVRAALAADDSLWELADSPLMLNVMTLAYQARTADALRTTGTLKQRQTQLFADYTERMFERRPIIGRRYTKEQAKRWLCRLASSMRAHNQSEFNLDRLQPDWLASPAQRRLVTLLPALVSGLVGGLLIWLVFWLVVGPVADWIARSGFRLGAGVGFGPDARVGAGLVAGLVFALIAVTGGRDIEPVRPLAWPWLGWGGGLGAGLVAGLLAGPVAGLVVGLLALGGGRVYELIRGARKRVGWSWQGLFAELGFGLVIGLIVGLLSGLVARRDVPLFPALLPEMIGGLAVALVAVAYKQVYELIRRDGMPGAQVINPVEQLRWSRPGLRGVLRVGLSGARAGLIVGLIVGPAFGLGGELGRGLALALRGMLGGELSLGLGGVLSGVRFGLVVGPAVGFAVGLAVGLVNALVNALVSGLTDKRVTPNEGIVRSARHGLAIGLVSGLIVGLVGGLVCGLAYGIRFGMLYGMPFGLPIGSVFGLLYGLLFGLLYGLVFGLEFGGIAYLRHLALRGLLVRNGDAPWRYVRFLDDATERLFLYRRGSSYIFVHSLLLEYFADLEDARHSVATVDGDLRRMTP
jgi:MinD-like ATPase involved in chromosome partitioning or flagellar assembly